MKYLIVIPARGGSKGIPLKNIYPLNGVPLLEYSLVEIKKIYFHGDVVVSTDSSKISDVAEKNNIEVVKRPVEISGDTASTETALLHALEEMERRKSCTYDAVITLQATSPLRTAETIKAAILAFEKKYSEYDALLTLTENRTDHWVQDAEGNFSRLYPNAPRRRQERKPLFLENSAIYITKADILQKTKSVLGSRTMGFVISEMESVDINEPIDLVIAEQLLKEREKRG